MAALDKQNRPPKVVVLPDGRYQVTEFWDVLEAHPKQKAKFEAEVKIAFGTEHATYTGCRLITQEMADPSLKPSADRHIWIRVYETLHATNETQVGSNTQIKLEDGRTAIEQNFLKLSSAGFTPSTIGSSGGPSTTYLMKEEAPNDGTLIRIKRTWVAAGLLQQDDQESHNGALLKRTLTYAVTVPPTPAGYTLVGSPVQHPNGLPIYTYTFYKGTGEISRRTSLAQNGTTTDGTVGVTRLDIDHLTAPGASEPSWSSVTGYTKIAVSAQEADGHMRWSALFAKGAGLVAQSIDYGPVGLRRVTNISLGTKVTPTGIVIQDDYREEGGYRVFTVATMQTAAGGADPTSGSTTHEDYDEFVYPGRAKAFSETYGGRTHMNVFESPPVRAKVKVAIATSYQTTTTLPAPSPALWNPTEWAVLRAQWIGFGDNPHNRLQAMPGYRSVSDTPLEETCSAIAPIDLSIFGAPVFGGTDAQIIVEGGPEDPGGNSYTLSQRLDPNPVFIATDGTPYYRLVVVTATIPAQAALPV